MLSITNLQVFYDHAVEAVRDVSLEVGEGRIVALLGSNGAGKSTVLKAICGVLYPEDGEIDRRHHPALSASASSAAPRTRSCAAAWCRCPKAAACSTPSPSRRTCCVGAHLQPAAGAAERDLEHLQAVPAARGAPPPQSPATSRAASSRWSRSAAR